MALPLQCCPQFSDPHDACVFLHSDLNNLNSFPSLSLLSFTETKGSVRSGSGLPSSLEVQRFDICVTLSDEFLTTFAVSA